MISNPYKNQIQISIFHVNSISLFNQCSGWDGSSNAIGSDKSDFGFDWRSRPLEGGNSRVIRSTVNYNSTQTQSPQESGCSNDNFSDRSERSDTCFGSSKEGDLIFERHIDQSQFILLNLFMKAIFSAGFRNHMPFWKFSFELTSAFFLLKFFSLYIFCLFSYLIMKHEQLVNGVHYSHVFSKSNEPITRQQLWMAAQLICTLQSTLFFVG